MKLMRSGSRLALFVPLLCIAGPLACRGPGLVARDPEAYRHPGVRWVYSPGDRVGATTVEGYLWSFAWLRFLVPPVHVAAAEIVGLQAGTDSTVVLRVDITEPWATRLAEPETIVLDLATGAAAKGEAAKPDARDLRLLEDPGYIEVRDDLALIYNPDAREELRAVMDTVAGPVELPLLIHSRRASPTLALVLPQSEVVLLVLHRRGWDGESRLYCIDLCAIPAPPRSVEDRHADSTGWRPLPDFLGFRRDEWQGQRESVVHQSASPKRSRARPTTGQHSIRR